MADLVQEKQHARLSPSGAKRWMTCPGSIKFVESLGIKDKPSKYAAEGTAAHEIHELCLRKDLDAKHYFRKVIDVDGMKFKVDEGMVEAVQESLDFIRNRIKEMGKKGLSAEVQVEVRSPLEYLGLEGLDGGTADVVILYRDTFKKLRAIDVIDYKHGRGVPVEVDHNPQGMCYALGICEKYKAPKNIPVAIVISQPRAYHPEGSIRSWEILAEDLYLWEKERLSPAAKETMKDGAALVPSEDGCRFCGAAGQCSKLFGKTQELAMVDFETLEDSNLPAPNSLTAEQKLAIVKHCNMIRAFVVAVENQVKLEVNSGSKEYEGELKLVRKTTHRKFKEDSLDEISSPLFDFLEENDIFVSKALPLTEIENALKKKIGPKKAHSVMKELTFKPKGELVIAPISDRRKAQKTSSQSDFENLEQL